MTLSAHEKAWLLSLDVDDLCGRDVVMLRARTPEVVAYLAHLRNRLRRIARWIEDDLSDGDNDEMYVRISRELLADQTAVVVQHDGNAGIAADRAGAGSDAGDRRSGLRVVQQPTAETP